MTPLLNRTRTAPLAAALAIGMLLPVVVLARPIHNGKRPATQTDTNSEAVDIALPAAGPCRAAADAELAVAAVEAVEADGGRATHPGIEVGWAEDDGREVDVEDAGELEISDTEAAAYMAAVAAFEKNGVIGNCDESDMDASSAK